MTFNKFQIQESHPLTKFCSLCCQILSENHVCFEEKAFTHNSEEITFEIEPDVKNDIPKKPPKKLKKIQKCREIKVSQLIPDRNLTVVQSLVAVNPLIPIIIPQTTIFMQPVNFSHQSKKKSDSPKKGTVTKSYYEKDDEYDMYMRLHTVY